MRRDMGGGERGRGGVGWGGEHSLRLYRPLTFEAKKLRSQQQIHTLRQPHQVGISCPPTKELQLNCLVILNAPNVSYLFLLVQPRRCFPRSLYYHDIMLQWCYTDDGDAIAMTLAITLIFCVFLRIIRSNSPRVLHGARRPHRRMK